VKNIVFSDTHLTHKFNQRKYNFLKKIILSGDKVIINGDFWDGYLIKFSQLLDSKWNMLFPLLKSKNTVYVYGNHDRRKKSDWRVNLFSVKQTEKYEIHTNKNTFIFEHGNKFRPCMDETKLKFLLISPIIKSVNLAEKLCHKRKQSKKLMNWFLSKSNKRIKLIINNEAIENKIYVTGHTHMAEKDLDNHFLNSGIIRYGIGQYLIIDTDKNKIELIEEKY
jgi:predicted phosphodiesterase